MLVYSFDKKSVVDASLLQVQRNLGGGKEAKYIISASRDALGETVVMAQFADEKTAVDALERAFRAFEEGAVSYRFGSGVM